MTMLHRTTAISLLLIAAGCGGDGTAKSAATIDTPPMDWSTLAGKPLTFAGRAGNSAKGPILRFDDQRIIGLAGMPLWAVELVGRDVGVVGTVGVGGGPRANEYVVNVQRVFLQQDAKVASPTPPSQSEPVIEPQRLPPGLGQLPDPNTPNPPATKKPARK